MLAPRAVSVADFGASPNNTAAQNTAAFLAAMQACPSVYLPAGVTYQIESVEVPASVTRISGAATLVAGGTVPAGKGLLDAIGNAARAGDRGCRHRGRHVTAYPNVAGIRLSNCAGAAVRGTNTGGVFGIEAVECADLSIVDCIVPSYLTIGIYLYQCHDFTVRGCKVNGGGIGLSHGIQMSGGYNAAIEGNLVTAPGPGGFGISIDDDGQGGQATNFAVAGNVILNSLAEGINVTGGAFGAVTGNVIRFGAGSTDFGMSFTGDGALTANDIEVSGNAIFNSHKSGIGLADGALRIAVTSNYIFAPNSRGT